jgi:putative FmdB family regulatory protein
MPIYEYMCNKCGNIFSILVMSSSQGKKLSCPSCGAADVVKKVSTFCSPSGGLGGGFGGGGGGFGGGT